MAHKCYVLTPVAEIMAILQSSVHTAVFIVFFLDDTFMIRASLASCLRNLDMDLFLY